MKFYLGGLTVSIDMTQLLNGNGLTLHANGEIRPNLNLALEVIYLPTSTEKLRVKVLVEETEEETEADNYNSFVRPLG